MSYTKTTWANGDVITAEKLNNLENGVVGAFPLVVEVTINGYTATLGNTWQEIHDALALGVPCFSHSVNEGSSAAGLSLITSAYYDNEYYMVEDGFGSYTTDSANGYPVNNEGPN